ncbi:DUF1656 domain-containing protein [Acinetobacter guerrae]|uniref:DUF1656 domain-containing protein n=1 Tax=Acinetobacter guerrae TaxID=1843371 RepID=A0A3A8EBT7_9GAMM|nr:DUF1656 domain-containing protein [Acinetobacter guerrae]MPW45670.1 hypothetical protein [Acinetobacter guerrae]RKG32337.1 DUF1656 domain-containing protein [Acinetobacter guerrae]
MGELNLYGVYVPTLLIQAILAYVLFKIVTLATNRLIEAGWIGFSGIFNLSLYVLMLMIVHWVFLTIQT